MQRAEVAIFVALCGLIVAVFLVVHFTPSAPTDKYAAVAVGIEGAPQTPGRGVRVDMHVTARSSAFRCRNPVEVTAVVSGTAEFWRYWSSRLGSSTRVAIAFSGARKEWKAGLAYGTKDIFRPKYATPLSNPDAAAEGDHVSSGSAPDATGLHTATADLHDWGRTWVPLIVKFKADWVARRTLGSCYLRIPALTSNQPGAGYQATNAALELLHADNQDISEVLPTTGGRIVLETPGANVRADLSSPAPTVNTSDDAIAQRATWVCHASATDQIAKSPGATISPTRRFIALPSAATSDAQGCGGFAVLEKSWAGPIRELALLVLGILISLATGRLPRLRKAKADSGTPAGHS